MKSIQPIKPCKNDAFYEGRLRLPMVVQPLKEILGRDTI